MYGSAGFQATGNVPRFYGDRRQARAQVPDSSNRSKAREATQNPSAKKQSRPGSKQENMAVLATVPWVHRRASCYHGSQTLSPAKEQLCFHFISKIPNGFKHS